MTTLTGGVETNVYIPAPAPSPLNRLNNAPSPRLVPISPAYRYVPLLATPKYLFPVDPHVNALDTRTPNTAIPNIPMDWLASDSGNRLRSIFNEPTITPLKSPQQLEMENEEIRLAGKQETKFPWWLLLVGGGGLAYYYWKKG